MISTIKDEIARRYSDIEQKTEIFLNKIKYSIEPCYIKIDSRMDLSMNCITISNKMNKNNQAFK